MGEIWEWMTKYIFIVGRSEYNRMCWAQHCGLQADIFILSFIRRGYCNIYKLVDGVAKRKKARWL